MKMPQLVSLLFLAVLGLARADTVYLTDGTEVEGTIVSDDGTTLTIRTKSGASRSFRRKDVETIERSKPAASEPAKKTDTTPKTTTAPATTPATNPAAAPSIESFKLQQVRSEFKTTLTQKVSANQPLETPPAGVFDKVEYVSAAGKLAAYLTPAPKKPGKQPAIIWITGGDCNSIGNVWEAQERTNDQSARAFREAGIVMMFPSLRGGNKNPGFEEGFYGEVDDVIAAAEFLSKKDYVDPSRIYLGGHSSGGTMALLVAECSQRFRAVFAFGPVEKIADYFPGNRLPLPFDHSNTSELLLRSPGFWLHCIQSPTFILEGKDGNHESLMGLREKSKNPRVKTLSIANANHFSVLAPSNEVIAQKILRDTAAECKIELSEEELQAALKK